MEDRKYIAMWAGGSGGATKRSQAAKPLSMTALFLLKNFQGLADEFSNDIQFGDSCYELRAAGFV
jgi:hypothetical protein